ARADFPEGIRARLMDKDGNPRWSDKNIATVSIEKVEEHFAAPWAPEEHPLRDL
ncbi:enoyl-CoA hydratase/isomerase family protein, partial [Verrucomicrobium sp. 3C]